MAVSPEQRLNPEERSNLVAYIDGELTENDGHVVDRLIQQFTDLEN